MFTFKVTPEGQPTYELVATSRDVFTWERTNRGASFGKLQDNLQMTDLYKIAGIAAIRQGRHQGTQQQFEETCDLDLVQDEGEADPTPPAP